MKDRIREIRKHVNLTQTEFGERIGVKGNTVTGYETGLRAPSDAIVLSICREFGVNENWIRTGEGDMLMELTREETISQMVSSALSDKNEFKAKFIAALARLDLEDWKMMEQLVWKISAEMNKEQ